MSQAHPSQPHQTRSSGSACPVRAGAKPASAPEANKPAMEIIRALLAEESGFDPQRYLQNVRAEERRELSLAAQKTLDAEVALLRSAIRRFSQAVNAEEEPEVITRLSAALNTLGLSCTRLGSMLKLNQALQETRQQQWERDISAELQALLREWENEAGGEHA